MYMGWEMMPVLAGSVEAEEGGGLEYELMELRLDSIIISLQDH